MVGARKNKSDLWLPPRCYRGRSAFEFHPKSGGAIRLCPLDAPKSQVLAAYELVVEAHKFNLTFVLNLFEESPQFSDLQKASQTDYRQSRKNVELVFGGTDPNKITTVDVRKYMDYRGIKSKVRANRELSFLSAVYSWARERGHAKDNPCAGVKRHKEKARTRYIEDAEYRAVYDRALAATKIAMEIAYLCAARQSDVLSLKWDQIQERGVFIRQGKTGKEQLKLFSPRLLAAIDQAKARRISSVSWVICNDKGQRYTRGGFNTNWAKVMALAIASGDLAKSFTFHDLKAKGVSDYEQGDKQEFSGHATRGQMEKYNRKVQEVSALDPGKKGKG